MGYLDTGLKGECCGCSVCAQICPKSAIRMQEDQEGFLYPKVDEALCIHCNLCREKCIQNVKVSFREPEKAMAGAAKSEEILMSSASGGAFYAILKAVEPETIVFGAKWVDRSHVEHEGVLVNKAYEQFRKSKYVQSAIGDCYRKAKDYLNDGKKVIFLGTPCQVQGLKIYLNKEYDRLLCVDLICHGVASSLFLDLALKELDTTRDKIKRVEFRHKEKRQGKWNSKLARIVSESGKTAVLDYDHFSFLRAYDAGLLFRPACNDCAFAKRERVSDITIGDYWGGELEGTFDPHHGASLILANTLKGFELLSRLEKYMRLELVDYDYAVAHNGRLRCPDKGNLNLPIFREMIKTQPFTETVNRYAPPVTKWKKLAHQLLKK